MLQPVVTRSQRRVERKQIVLVIVLIIAVAGVSFTLGVMFGQRTMPGAGQVSDSEPPTPVAVTQPVPLPPPPAADGGAEKQDKLTFYDNLPKGNQAPLGSGINLPPEPEKPAAETKAKGTTKSPAAAEAPAPDVKTVVAPAAAADGAFIVQIASFRGKADAGKLVQRLTRYQLKASVEAVDLGSKGVWYRVLAGPYPSRESADQVAGLLRDKERLSALVRQR